MDVEKLAALEGNSELVQAVQSIADSLGVEINGSRRSKLKIATGNIRTQININEVDQGPFTLVVNGTFLAGGIYYEWVEANWNYVMRGWNIYQNGADIAAAFHTYSVALQYVNHSYWVLYV